jgi:TonB-dependent receptor
MLELPLSARVTVISGARHEYSTYSYTGRSFDGVTLRPLRSSNDNGVWLPGVHARYALDHDTIVRGAVTRSFARPDFEDLSPFQISDGDTVSMGNPFLEPTVAWNTDVAVERYLRPVGLISVALFHKRLDQQIYSFTTTSTVNGNPIQITQAQNGDAATIAGLELSFQQQLRMLPSPFDSLGVYATYSRTASHAQYPLRSSAPLPGQSRHLGDVTVFYERGGFSGRAAVSFRSQSLARVGRAEANDQFLVGRAQLDLSIAQRVRRRTWVVFDVDNLSDAPDTGFAQSPSRLTSIEHFGRYVTFGLRLAF